MQAKVISLQERIEQEKADERGELLVYGCVLYALRDISQEINTVISALAQLNNGRKEPGFRMFEALKKNWSPLELAAISRVVSIHAGNLQGFAHCLEESTEGINSTLSPGERLWVYEYVKSLGDYSSKSGGTILEKHLEAALQSIEEEKAAEEAKTD